MSGRHIITPRHQHITTLERMPSRGHHNVYVVYLRNPKGDGKAGYYVGMTGLSPVRRFQNHKAGVKAARVIKPFGGRRGPRLRSLLKPLPFPPPPHMDP